MRVLVVTIVHDPRDARIRHREINALLNAGHHVTYAAPFSGYGVALPTDVDVIDLPRAQGRQRVEAIRVARRLIAQCSHDYDIVLIHDPELLIAARASSSKVTVWDVHEDTAAAVTLKPWLPSALRQPTATIFRSIERNAESRFKLLLAETEYASRFSGKHPVVPNSTAVPDVVPPAGNDRVVYVGSVTRERGAFELIEVGRQLRAHNVHTHVLGSADQATRDEMTAAHARGDIVWHGFVPNDEAMAIIEGSMAGLSLLHDEPNYRHSQPTKVLEYMAHGVPVVTTPLPRAQSVVDTYGSGVVVPFNDPAAVVTAALALKSDESQRMTYARNGHAAALRDFNWDRDGIAFVDTLATWVREASSAHTT